MPPWSPWAIRRPYVVALITLDPAALTAFAEEHGIAADVSSELTRCPEVWTAIQEGVDRANARLSRVELIKYFAVLPEAWTPGGDELTPTNKLRRRAIGEKYAAEIDAAYVGGTHGKSTALRGTRPPATQPSTRWITTARISPAKWSGSSNDWIPKAICA